MVLANEWVLKGIHADELSSPKQKQLCLFEFRHLVANTLALEKKTVMAVKRGSSLISKESMGKKK